MNLTASELDGMLGMLALSQPNTEEASKALPSPLKVVITEPCEEVQHTDKDVHLKSPARSIRKLQLPGSILHHHLVLLFRLLILKTNIFSFYLLII